MGTLVQLRLFILLALITIVTSKNRVPWWQIKVTKSQGPNACIVEEVPELNKKYWTECKYWPVRKVCARETIVRYECCEGFKQISGEEGCTGVKSLKNVLETARELGARKFVEYLEAAGMSDELSRDGTFTLFAPFDHAFDTASGAVVGARILRSPRDPILNYHISRQKHISKEFGGNTEIVSQYNARKLRISKYSTGMETVNCILISRKDQEATNGVVHMIDHPLDPSLFMPKDVVEIVVQDGRFRKMSDAMDRCGFADRLRGGTFTILAPSDEAFLKIPPSRLEKMFNDPAACTAMLENHVIPHVMCMPVITEEFKARSIGPQKVGFDCDVEKGHVVEGRRVGEYLLGGNGVVYVLDDVLIPDRSRTMMELIQSRHLVTFAQLAQVAGLEDMLNGRGDFTLFVPSEAAWYTIDYELLEEAKQNPDLARRLLLFHATAGPGSLGRLLTSTITNNQVVTSLDGENSLRLQVYRKSFGVEDAIIETQDIEGANGVLHIVSKVLFPATESAGDILRKSGNYSMFLQTMESILQQDPGAIDISNGHTTQANHYTFFVPTNAAFRTMGQSRLRRLQTDPEYMRRVMRNHISSSMASSHSFKPNLLYDMPTRQNPLGISCDTKNKMKVNNAEVLKKDVMSTNGIIHVVDRILLPDNDY